MVATCQVKEIIERRLSDLNNESASFWIRSKSTARYSSVSPCQRMSELCCSLDPDFFFGSAPSSSSRKPCTLANLLNAVLVLQEISEKLLTFQSIECESDTLFFSALGSVNDISDCILRRLRGFLMSMSSECIKIELMGDCRLNESLSKTEGSLADDSCKVKKKGRNSKKLNSTTKASKVSYQRSFSDV